jgi:hypothetical protein
VPIGESDGLAASHILAFAERLLLALMSVFDVKHKLIPTADLIVVGGFVAPV